MRGDQPVVSAASLMVRASIRSATNLITVVSRLCGDRLGRDEDLAPAAVLALVEPDDRAQRGIGSDQPLEDVVLGHRVVAVPRRGHVDDGARARATGVLLGRALLLTERRDLPAGRLAAGGGALRLRLRLGLRRRLGLRL